MTEKEMEQKMLDEINKYKPLIAAIGCCDIAKKYAQQEVEKLIIPVVSQLSELFTVALCVLKWGTTDLNMNL